MMRRLPQALVLLVLLMTVAACTGIPASSGPEVVRTVGLGEAPAPSAPAPPVGADPRTIVGRFFDAMGTSPDRPDAARAYLDTDAAQRWTPSPVNIIADSSFNVGSEDKDHNTVSVAIQPIGTVSATGVYTPQLAAQKQSIIYNYAKNADGQYRIRTPVPTGIYIKESDFTRLFAPRPLYYLNSAGTRLVPDVRWSALNEASLGLDTFLLTQLTAQEPPGDLGQAVSPFQPAPTGNQRVSVATGSPTVVTVPGALALDDAGRRRLAAQLAYTLNPSTSFQSGLQIKDGTQALSIQGIGDTFNVSDFSDFAPDDDSESVSATYVRDGGVVDATGTPLGGKLGTSQYHLDSAVFDSDGGRTLVAATTEPDGNGDNRLLIGDNSGLTDVKVPRGPLSAPVWAPIGTSADTDEVWVASGHVIYRFVPGVRGARPTSVTITGQNTPITGTIVSMAFAPEGSRLALIIDNGDTSQVYTASVARTGTNLTVDLLPAITPPAYHLTGVGWRSVTTLAAVGSAPSVSSLPVGVYLEVGVDGSRLRPASPDGLPEPPRSLAVSTRDQSEEWVTTGSGSNSLLWTRSTSSSTWSKPAGLSSQLGRAPSFST